MKVKSIKVCLITFLILGLFTWGYPGEVRIKSSLFNSIYGRTIGPAVMSGRITAIDGIKNIIYVGTAGGGVWKSVDNGINFSPIFEKHTMCIGCLTIDKNNPENIWVGTGEINVRNSVSIGTGLYKSEDSGKHWKLVGFKDSERIAKILIHPKNSKIIYVAVLGHLWDSNEQRGLYKSTDGGKKWNKILYVNKNTGCTDVEMDPFEPDIMYASMWQFRRRPDFFQSGGPGCGLYQSKNGGRTWANIKKNLPQGKLGRISLAISKSRPGAVYANIEVSNRNSGLYRSLDMGNTWELMNNTFQVTMRPFYFSHIVVDNTDYKKIFATGLFLSVSKDGGKNFVNVLSGFSMGRMHPDIHEIWLDPDNTKRIIVGTDGGVYISNDGGKAYRFVANLPVSQFYHVAYDMKFPYNVYGGLQDNGAWYGPSNNPRRGSIQNKDWHNVGGGDGFYVLPDFKDPNIIFYSWQEGNLERYNKFTNETKDIKPRLTEKGKPEYRYHWNAAVELSKNTPGTIYIGAQYLFKSLNRGDDWEKISPDLTTNNPAKQQQYKSGGITTDDTGAENHCTIVTVSESPLDKNIIWAGTDDGNVQVTKNGGKTWINTIKNVPGLPKNTWCSSVIASNFNKAAAYASFDGHRTGDFKPYIYKTSDYGKTWVNITSKTIEGYCFKILEDLKNPQLLFSGTVFGLYVSLDQGANWARMKSIPKTAIRDLTIHPREHDLILATHGLGIIIIDDITPIRSLTGEILNKDVALLPARTAVMKTPSGVQEFPGAGEFYGENSPGGALITYYLKKRHLFGDFKLEILNDKGKVIQVLPATKSKGINRVYWGMRLKPPKAAGAPGLSGAMLGFGPMVKPGIYTVKITKNKKVYTGKISLIPDPVANHSVKDRQIRYEAVMTLYGMQEELGYIADNLNNFVKHSREIAKKSKKKSLKNRLKSFYEKMEKFHKTIVQHKGLMTSEKLRGRVTGLYSSILKYGGKPTSSQLYNVEVLKHEIKKVETKFKDILTKDFKKTNSFLKGKKLKPLKLISKKEYRNKGK